VDAGLSREFLRVSILRITQISIALPNIVSEGDMAHVLQKEHDLSRSCRAVNHAKKRVVGAN